MPMRECLYNLKATDFFIFQLVFCWSRFGVAFTRLCVHNNNLIAMAHAVLPTLFNWNVCILYHVIFDVVSNEERKWLLLHYSLFQIPMNLLCFFPITGELEKKLTQEKRLKRPKIKIISSKLQRWLSMYFQLIC